MVSPKYANNEKTVKRSLKVVFAANRCPDTSTQNNNNNAITVSIPTIACLDLVNIFDILPF
ncbi:hypothetical protein LLA04_13730 [Leuconostoc lactis]|nr:hypothetical protein LLA04_13730 [Leuconostoc lactis]